MDTALARRRMSRGPRRSRCTSRFFSAGGLLLLAVCGEPIWALAIAARRVAYEEEDPHRRVAARILLALVIVLVPMHFVMPYFVDTGLPQLLVLAGIALAGSY